MRFTYLYRDMTDSATDALSGFGATHATELFAVFRHLSHQ